MKRIVTTVYVCNAPAELFGPYDEVPQELKDEIPDSGLGCDGGGKPGSWCHDLAKSCPWAAEPFVVEINESTILSGDG